LHALGGVWISTLHLSARSSHHKLCILSVSHVSHVLHHLGAPSAIAIDWISIAWIDCLVEHTLTIIGVVGHYLHLRVHIVEILALSRHHALIAVLWRVSRLDVVQLVPVLLLSVHLLSKEKFWSICFAF
jgi:hypothetical protein